MSFDWSQYLNIALELLDREDVPASPEAKKRAAISRAYYAALQKARVQLQQKDLDPHIPNDRGLHDYVIQAFQRHPDTLRKEIGLALEKLRVQRGRADYRDKYPDLDKQVELCLKFANDVLMLLTKL
jgi:uncharacterized protein (UPF0332 family)